MKSERISEHVWSLRTWLIVTLTVWMVKEEDGWTLVDTGMPFMAKGIAKFVEEAGAGPLKRILLTHGHGDHVGGVKEVLKRFPVPVFAHRLDIPYIEGEAPFPRRKKAAELLPKGLVQPLPESQSGHLFPVGGLMPIFTPGHSPGHVVYHHQADDVVLAGDLFTSKNGQLRRPMPQFTADMDEALRSGEMIKQMRPKIVAICHGAPVHL